MYLSYNVGTYIYILIYILSCNIRIGIQKEYQYTAWFGLQQYIRIYWYILHLCTCVHVHSSQHTTVTSQSTSFQLRTVKAGQTWQNTFSVVVNWPWRDCSWKHFPADTHTHTHTKAYEYSVLPLPKCVSTIYHVGMPTGFQWSRSIWVWNCCWRCQ